MPQLPCCHTPVNLHENFAGSVDQGAVRHVADLLAASSVPRSAAPRATRLSSGNITKRAGVVVGRDRGAAHGEQLRVSNARGNRARRSSARRPGSSSRSASGGRRGQRSSHGSLVDVVRPDGASPDGSSSRSAFGGRPAQRSAVVEVSGAPRSPFGRTLVDGAWLGCITSRSPVGARARRGAARRGDTRTRDETLLVMQRARAIDQRSDRFSCPNVGS